MVARRVLRHLHPLFDAAYRLRRAAAREAARQRFKTCGRNVVFDPLSSDIDYEQISVGSDVYIGWGAYLFGPIDIGDDVIFGPEVHVQAGYHRIDVAGSTIRASGGDVREKVTIGHDVWVAARATILKGVTVGDGAVVGTGAVVTRDVEPYTVVAGNPARVLRPRFTAADLERHLAMRTPPHRRSGSSLPSP